MSTVTQSARGASAFTHASCPPSHPSHDAVPNFSGTEFAPRHTWDLLIDELLRLRNLGDDWDGEGTEAPHPALVDRAITLAQILERAGWTPANRVIASVNGTVYFEWYTHLEYQEIEVTSPRDVEFRRVRKDSNETEVFGLDLRS